MPPFGWRRSNRQRLSVTSSLMRRRSFAVFARWRSDRGEVARAMRSFPRARYFCPVMKLFMTLAFALAASPAQAQDCPPPERRLSHPVPTIEDMFNPNPSKADIELPMPCGGKLVLRHVCVPATGHFGDLQLDLGCEDCGRPNQGFMEGKRRAVVSGPFTLQDLPEAWRNRLAEFAKMGDGQCPDPNDKTTTGFYYFIGKYEISNFQWKAVMEGECPGSEGAFSADDPRPKTGISWFEAVDFTRRYTEWLLKNRPDALPRFSGGRFGYLRLPTEAEWEYAARGGHLVPEAQMNQEEFFPLNERPHSDYAVFTATEAAKPPEKLAWIGSKCSNPLGLFDTAGNAAEMLLDPFHFSVGARLHGTAGGFVVKGGSYRKRKAEVMPGRREELPFFLEEGAFRSTDLGFRVVLSAIVTPENRKEDLDKEWASIVRQNRRSQPGHRSLGPMIEIDQSRDSISEIDRLEAASKEDRDRTSSLKEVIKQNTILLAEQKAETVKAVIRSALFASESLMNYAIRRKDMLKELSRLKRIKEEIMSQSSIKALDVEIANAFETIRMFDEAIDSIVQFYLNSLSRSRMYSDDIFEHQMGLIYQELNRENRFNRALKMRLDLFKRHVALYKSRPESISPNVVLEDIIPETARPR